MPRKHTDETKRLISEGVKRWHRENRALKDEGGRNTPPKSDDIKVWHKPGDKWRSSFYNITPAKVRNALQSTYDGKLDLWSDLVHAMLERDVIIRSGVERRVKAISGKDWRVEPSGKSDEGKLAADLISQMMDTIPGINKAFYHLAMGAFTGHEFAAIEWEYDDQLGLFIPDQIRPILQKKWELKFRDETGEWVYWFRDAEGQEWWADDPKNWGRFLIHSPGVEVLPHERGLLRVVAMFYLQKLLVREHWLVGSESYAYDSIMAFVPNGTPENIMQALAANLNLLQGPEGKGVFDERIRVEPLNTSGAAAAGNNIWDTIERRISDEIKTLLYFGTLTDGSVSTGANRALGEVHERGLTDAVLDDAEALANTFRDQLFKPFLKFNAHLFGGTIPPVPRLWFNVTTKKFRQTEPWMLQMGVVSPNEVRTELGLEPIEGGDEAKPIEQGSPTGGGGSPTHSPEPSREPQVEPVKEFGEPPLF